MLQERQNIFAINFSKLIQKIIELGFTVSLGEVWRSPEQQAFYFRNGKSKTLNSMHLLRLAGEINIFANGKIVYDAEKLKSIGLYWCDLHPSNRWGGDWDKDNDTTDETFPDIFHFEMRY